eukprot:665102-Alexandrium_andersonii.AAC.1
MLVRAHVVRPSRGSLSPCTPVCVARSGARAAPTVWLEHPRTRTPSLLGNCVPPSAPLWPDMPATATPAEHFQ